MMQEQTYAAKGDEAQGAQKALTGELLFLLAGLAALGALATNIILPTFPDMAVALGTSVIDLSATLSSFFVAFAVGQLFVGPLSDRFGRRWLVLVGLLAFVVGSAICAFASTLPQLIGTGCPGARGLHNIGFIARHCP
jgi:DHA1 family bicyclomycin/chloramphenicol resistance-like MFS transporter